MSSFLCFLCHSTVNADTSEDMREKYRDVVGMNLCLDSHLCYICCHVLNKLSLFKSVCLKRSLEYPVLFSEKGTLNLQRTDLEIHTCCPDDMCGQYHHRNFNANSYQFLFNNFTEYESHQEYINRYVELADERADFDEYFNINEIIAKEPVVFVSKCVQTDNTDDQNEKDDEIDFVDKEIQTDDVVDDFAKDFHEGNGSDDDEIVHNNNNANNNKNDENINIRNDVDSLDNHSDDLEYDNNVPGQCNDRNASAINQELQKTIEEYENIELEEQTEDFKQEVGDENIEEDGNEELEEEAEDFDENGEKQGKKRKKKAKERFKKMVLSLEEQRADLERKRKEKKYLEAEFKCYSCALGFLFKDTYQAHMMRHEESNGEHRCPTCTLRFASHRVLLGHYATHSARYICLKCGGTVQKRARKKHEQECWQTIPIDETQVTCHLCGKMFGNANARQQHVKRYHGSRECSGRRGCCALCGTRCGTQAALRTHMLKHLNRKFDCDECGSTFSNPYTLRQHKRRHEIKDSSHYCECGAVFGSRKNLLAHRRNSVQHQQELVGCPLCSRQCPTERALSLHISRVHSGAHPVPHRPRNPPPKAVCHLCGASFKGNNKLNRHLKKSCKRAKMEDGDFSHLYDHD